MAKQIDKTDKQFAQIEDTLSKTEQYIEDNQRSLTVIVGAIVSKIYPPRKEALDVLNEIDQQD